VAGEGGRFFLWRKFRSMTVAGKEEVERRQASFRAYAEGSLSGANGERAFKVINRQRVTPLGHLIRKHSLDELPQLGNVFRGEMSLVGPRPCLPYEMEYFAGWRWRRFTVPPGLTGMWQVFGRGRVGHEEAAAMDVFYTYRRSFGLDLYLMWKTAAIVVNGEGAA